MTLLLALALLADPPSNLASAWVTPLVLYDAAGVEYQRLLTPALGVSVAASGGWQRLGSIEATHESGSVGIVFALPDPVERTPPPRPAGPLAGVGVTVSRWEGTYRDGSFRSRLAGSAVEPELWAGYRLVVGHFFLEPRAGAGWSFGGAHYESATGRRIAYHGFATIGPFSPHAALVVGLAW